MDHVRDGGEPDQLRAWIQVHEPGRAPAVCPDYQLHFRANGLLIKTGGAGIVVPPFDTGANHNGAADIVPEYPRFLLVCWLRRLHTGTKRALPDDTTVVRAMVHYWRKGMEETLGQCNLSLKAVSDPLEGLTAYDYPQLMSAEDRKKAIFEQKLMAICD